MRKRINTIPSIHQWYRLHQGALHYAMAFSISGVLVIAGERLPSYWLGITGFFLLGLSMLSLGFRLYFFSLERKLQDKPGKPRVKVYQKKHPKLDQKPFLGLFRGALGNLALLLSLGLVLAAFEWKTYEPIRIVDPPYAHQAEPLVSVPVTEQKPAPPPAPKVVSKAPRMNEVDDEQFVRNAKADKEEERPRQKQERPPMETTGHPFAGDSPWLDPSDNQGLDGDEAVEAPKKMADQVARFPGGDKAWLDYLRNHTEYPESTKRMGIEGSVVVKFVVEKDGSITDVELVRGLGYGLDKEALRAVANSPNWEPALHNGRLVRFQKYVSIHFKLRK